MDAVSLHQRGIDNAVASLGTALTEQQGRLLKRYKSKIIIGYDSDSAGQGATMRGLEILQGLGYDIRILVLEGAKDPDEFVIKYGSGKFELYLKNAIYGISKEAIYAELNKLEYANSKGEKVLQSLGPVNRMPKSSDKKEDIDVSVQKENLLIFLLINAGPEVYKAVKDKIIPDDFKNEKNKKIVKVLYEELEKGDISNIIGLFENDEELMGHVTYILSKELDITDVTKATEDLINKFTKEKLQEEKAEILKKSVSGDIDKEKSKEIENRLKEISKRLVELK